MSEAKPLIATKRIDNYVRQNGCPRLTVRQRRRADHKTNHALAPFMPLKRTTVR